MCKNEFFYIIIRAVANMSEWWNGRHVRFRCVWRNLCGFKSHLRQVKKSNIGYSFFYVDWSKSNDTWQLCHLTQITPHPSPPRVGEGINLIFVSPHHTPSEGVGINHNLRTPYSSPSKVGYRVLFSCCNTPA